MVVENHQEINVDQFYMLKICGQSLLQRPISISEKKDDKLTFIYAVCR